MGNMAHLAHKGDHTLETSEEILKEGTHLGPTNTQRYINQAIRLIFSHLPTERKPHHPPREITASHKIAISSQIVIFLPKKARKVQFSQNKEQREMQDIEISEIIQSIPYAFWKSFAYQQINKRKDLKQPRWSILVNDNGVQVHFYYNCSNMTYKPHEARRTLT